MSARARWIRLAVVALCVACGAGAAAQSVYVPERVFEGPRGKFGDFETMLADVATADVVFLGEQHDDPNTHRLERAVLEGLARRRGDVILSLEMFERDVQEPLMHFGMGHAEEAEFLAGARPWPRYQTDYKPLVDFAIARNWSIVAANVPRSIATAVSKAGLDALKGRPETEQGWFAKDLQCPTNDDYYKRFVEAMGGHGADGGGKVGDARLTTDRFYLSQCVKDETMAEAIAQAYAGGSIGGKRPLVVHVNGSFHSDYGQGTAARTRRRLSGKRVVVISLVPVTNLDTLSPNKNDRKRADYLIYTIGKPAS